VFDISLKSMDYKLSDVCLKRGLLIANFGTQCKYSYQSPHLGLFYIISKLTSTPDILTFCYLL